MSNPQAGVPTVPQQSVIHIFKSLAEAEDAVKRLIDQKFPSDHISIVTQKFETEKQVQGYITLGDVAKQGAGTGAWVGGVFGLLFGAAFVWIPVFGPLIVVGPFAVALFSGVEGAMAGAAAGGVLGALFGWGVSKEHILKYEEVVKAGQYLVIANGDVVQVNQASIILDGLTAERTYSSNGEKVLQT